MNELLNYFQIDLNSYKGYLKVLFLAAIISFVAHSVGNLMNIS